MICLEGIKVDKCKSCKWDDADGGWAACDECIHNPGLKDRFEPLTNGERVRRMSDDELAQLLSSGIKICDRVSGIACRKGRTRLACAQAWIKEPAEVTEKGKA